MKIFTSPVIAVSIEGYSMGSRQSQKHGAGELGGVVKLALADAGIPYAVVAPTSLKLWIAGHGHATKADMMTQVCLRSCREITNDDEADAMALCWVTLEALGIETPMHSAPDPRNLVASVRRQLPRALWP